MQEIEHQREYLNRISVFSTLMEEFDRYKKLKYALLWFGIPSGTAVLSKEFGITDLSIIFLLIIIAVLLVAKYLTDEENKHLKAEIEKLERKIYHGKEK